MERAYGDPRLAVIDRRLAGVKKVLAIMSSKGGVGKTVIASSLAISLSSRGVKVGLLDLDVTNPTAHVVLGIDLNSVRPVEEKGVIPPKVYGVRFMSVAFFSGDNPLPLRGYEVDSVIREVLAVSLWGDVDVLLIDTPPGMSDESLDTLTYLRRPRVVVVTTPSPLSLRSVERLLTLLNEGGEDVAGVIENMSRTTSRNVEEVLRRFGVKFLGSVPYDPDLDRCLGSVDLLKGTEFYRYVERISRKLL